MALADRITGPTASSPGPGSETPDCLFHISYVATLG